MNEYFIVVLVGMKEKLGSSDDRYFVKEIVEAESGREALQSISDKWHEQGYWVSLDDIRKL